MSANLTLSGAPRFERIAWADSPPFIKGYYSPNKDLFLLMEDFRITWREWEILVRAGSISDLSSMPWFLAGIGATKANATNWMDAGAHVHDMGYMGARFPGRRSQRQERMLWDQLKFDLWNNCADERLRPWLRHRTVRTVSWMFFRERWVAPFAELGWVDIRPVETIHGRNKQENLYEDGDHYAGDCVPVVA